MAKDVIDRIRNAESSAEQTVAQAQIDAQQTIANAQRQAKELARSYRERALEQTKKTLATAENEAYKIKKRAAEENEREIKAETAPSIARTDTAAQYIISQIIE